MPWYHSKNERKLERHFRPSEAALPLYPLAIGYSRWTKNALQVRNPNKYFSLEYVLSGSLRCRCDGHVLQVQAGSVLLKQRDDQLRLQCGPEGYCHKINIAMGGPLLPHLLDLLQLKQQSVLCISRAPQPAAQFRHLFCLGMQTTQSSDDLSPVCYQLLCQLTQAGERHSGDKIWSAIVSFMHQHLHEPLSLDSWATGAGIHRRTLVRLFHQHLNTSPMAHVKELRLKRAEHMLLDQPTLLVKQVAHLCGFQDQRYLSRLFQQRHGCSPSEYRDKRRASQ